MYVCLFSFLTRYGGQFTFSTVEIFCRMMNNLITYNIVIPPKQYALVWCLAWYITYMNFKCESDDAFSQIKMQQLSLSPPPKRNHINHFAPYPSDPE